MEFAQDVFDGVVRNPLRPSLSLRFLAQPRIRPFALDPRCLLSHLPSGKSALTSL